MIRIFGLFAIIAVIYYFITKPGQESCTFLPLPASTVAYTQTLDVLEQNTLNFFDCLKSGSNHLIAFDEIPPCRECTSTDYNRPGNCKPDGSLPDFCPPPQCVVSFMRCAVTKDRNSVIILKSSKGTDSCNASPIVGEPNYYRYSFDPAGLRKHDGETIEMKLIQTNKPIITINEKF